MILSCSGAIAPVDRQATNILVFESALFDRSASLDLSKVRTSRIYLENRWEVLQEPDKWLDNVTGSLDALELELKAIRDKKTVVCFHSNDQILQGGPDFIERFKSITEREKITCILSISVPEPVIDEIQSSEYLVSHIHYGSQSGLFFGLLGPLRIDSNTTPVNVHAYTRAQEQCGFPLLLIDVVDWKAFDKFGPMLIKERSIVFGAHSKSHLDQLASQRHVNVGITCRDIDCSESLAMLDRAEGLGLRPVISTGTQYKTDLKKFGGRGVDYLPNFAASRLDATALSKMNAHALSLLHFTWEPPKLATMREELIVKWVCDVCGHRGRTDEEQNYTKLGFTYCSIKCLSEHRKRNFQ